ncbi:MAG: hypothetical protein ACUVR3_10920 [Candidatus Roseilinea sp.]|uniref:hypothetical protein n=1 Tax=Candidatus Roseilinea sp. TaxID=2838777 RepID=UPI00404A3AB1
MKTQITKQDLQMYRRRWQAVDRRDVDAQRTRTIDERWHELMMLFAFAVESGLIVYDDSRNRPDQAAVWERWQKLRAGK